MKVRHCEVWRAFAAPTVLAAILAVAIPVHVSAQTPPPAQVPRGNLEITVGAADAKKFQDCVVTVRDKAVNFGDSRGPKIVEGVPALPDESVAVTADAKVAQGSGKPALRFVGVTETVPEAGKTVKVTVTLKRADDINAFCAACHPGKGQRKKPGQIKRDTHPSGKPLEGRYRDQVRIYNEKIDRLAREGKPHGEPIIVEERIVKVGAKEVKKDFYTCESCHTLHATTPNPKYMRASYLDKSDLCTGCHF